jgi:hypothetical protein
MSCDDRDAHSIHNFFQRLDHVLILPERLGW